MTKKLFWLFTVSCWLLSSTVVPAQTRKSAQKKARTTQTTKKKPATNGKKTKAKSQQSTVKGLQTQRQQLQRQIQEQERKLQANRQNVKKRLENLQIINTEIADKRRTIDTIRHDIGVLDGNINTLNIQVEVLDKRLNERKQNYMNSMRYMHRNRSLQNQLMFIFSAKNFTQMYRRLRFMREYAKYQKAQGEAVMTIQDDIKQAQEELTAHKRQKDNLLNRGEQERRNLEGKQAEQQQVVNSLQKEQKTIESLITQQRKKDQALNAQIEKLIAEEIARAKARAEAEARAEAKRKAAEAAARENARRIAEAKAREEQAKKQALAAARKSAAEKAAAEAAAREAENARREAERKASEEAQAHEREVAEVRKKEEVERRSFTVSSEDSRLSGNFESNRGRLPMPITGGYRIVSGFGQNAVEGLKGVQLDNKGINLKGQPGAMARSVFNGEVCAVFNIGGVMGVMVRHGSYISVYSNLSSVSVHRGQQVSARQTLGAINADGILHFQLRKGAAPQNPARWLGR